MQRNHPASRRDERGSSAHAAAPARARSSASRPAPDPAGLMWRAATQPGVLRADDVLALQGSIGNQAVQRLLAARGAPVGAPRDLHGPGCGCGGCAPVPAEPVQRFAAGYQPRLASRLRKQNNRAYSRATFARPNFDEAIIQAVYHEARPQTANHPITHQPELWYQCASCHHWFQYQAMQIGHKKAWQDYVEDADPHDTAEARDAYNDLNNLYLQCTTCNQSHAWEGESGSEDYSSGYESDHVAYLSDGSGAMSS